MGIGDCSYKFNFKIYSFNFQFNYNMKKNDKKGAFKKNEPIFDPDIYEEE